MSEHPTLLIADDDPLVHAMLSAQLARSFKIVGGARDAHEAIALVAAQRPDVAIIDVQMPGGGGLRATRDLQRQAPGTAIVALSADESEGVVREMMKAGAITYIRKGMPADELTLRLLRSIAAHARLRRWERGEPAELATGPPA